MLLKIFFDNSPEKKKLDENITLSTKPCKIRKNCLHRNVLCCLPNEENITSKFHWLYQALFNIYKIAEIA